MQVTKYSATLALFMAPAALTLSLDGWCSPKYQKAFTVCDDSNTNIMYCYGKWRRWVLAYTCPEGKCAQTSTRNGGQYAYCERF
ncbi:hypothetical protein LMH87_001979 [Akanthomyces muscarius]|uniref:Secreted protein n=1 Tax=Akanthomyces muscarius TaxID=2231603 RepID=A0A9W8Q5Y9_AKAMU|nr:hypothetical protein LMH87_001979 [Akanthomyces muscarius]KAJ4147464.1 hypothetical protein LMH87_001979 [Akanthomyces muscarius]